MGFIDGKHIEEADVEESLGYEHQTCVDIKDRQRPSRYSNFQDSNKIGSKAVRWNIGDRLRLYFDLKAPRCTVFLNDRSLGSLTDDLPKRFYLGASVEDRGTKLETTVFEFW